MTAAIGPGFFRPFGLIDSDQAGFLLLPVIGRRIGVAHHRHFRVRFQEFPDRFCDDVMMLHIGDRHVGSDPLIDQPGIAAARIDHMFAGDIALLGDDLPFAGRQLLHVQDPVVAFDLRAHVARALGQGIAAAGRIDMTVIQCPGGGQHTGRVDMRIDRLDLVRADHLHAEADQLGDAFDLLEIVHLRLVGGEAQPAAAMPGDILTGHRLQLGIEHVSVMVDLRHVVVGDEAGHCPAACQVEPEVNSPFSISRLSVQPS